MKKMYLSLGLVAGLALASSAQVATFNFTGGIQTFTVPCGVDTLFVQAWGAQGGNGAAGGNNTLGGNGGLGGYAEGWLLVNPGDVLNVFVGGQGATPTGGFNGGANAGSQNAGGGGGASDIRVGGTAEANRVITAGGGGGGGRAGCESNTAGVGGNGGTGGGGAGVNGGDSPTPGGVAGGGKGGNFGSVQGAAGAAGAGCGGFLGSPGGTASTGTGAPGGAGQSCCCFTFGSIPGGGGGGGGQLGGGGGGGGSAGTTGCSGNDKGAGGGGGGGSSYVGGVLNGLTNNGIWLGNGMVTISWTDPIPPAHTITGTNVLCEGISTNLNINSDQFSTLYTWTVPNGLIFNSGQNTTSINITGGFAGTFWVYVMGVNSNCSFNGPVDSMMVTVNALPALNASSTAPVCLGGSETLSVTGASTYDWQPGSLSGSSVVVSPSVTTTYTVTGTDTNGCVSTDSVTAFINQPPVGVANVFNSILCLNDATNLDGSGGGTYVWMPGSLTGANPSIAPTATTTYTLIVTDGNGCVDSSATVTVNVNPLPVVSLAGLGTHCSADGSFTLTGGTPAGGTYSGPGVSGGTFSPATAGVGTHAITYAFTDANGCSASAVSNIVVNACTGVNEIAGFTGVSYMPNPATDVLMVNWNAANTTVNTIEITDIAGRLVATQQVSTNGSATVNVANLPAGNYNMVLISNDAKATYSFVKK